VKKSDVIPAGLLFSLLYHCGFKIKFNDQVFSSKNLTREKVQRPFPQVFDGEEIDEFEFEAKSKIFGFRKVEIRELSDKFRKYRENKDLKKCENALNIRINIEKALGTFIALFFFFYFNYKHSYIC
jgi:hypothetical protein